MLVWAKLTALAALELAAGPLQAEALEPASPDGNITLTFSDEGGLATHAISYDGEQVVAPSRLGMLFAEHHGFEHGLAIAGPTRASNDST